GPSSFYLLAPAFNHAHLVRLVLGQAGHHFREPRSALGIRQVVVGSFKAFHFVHDGFQFRFCSHGPHPRKKKENADTTSALFYSTLAVCRAAKNSWHHRDTHGSSSIQGQQLSTNASTSDRLCTRIAFCTFI